MASETTAARIDEARRLYYESRGITDDKARRERLEKGLDAARAALAIAAKDPGAIVWWSANLGALAEMKRNPWSLGAIKDIERALKELAKRDPAYGFAAADRALGKLYEKAPRFFSVGSSSKAEERLRRAVELAPEFPGNHVALAAFLFDDGRTEEARSVAEKVRKSATYAKSDFGAFTPEKKDWESELDRILSKTQGKLP